MAQVAIAPVPVGTDGAPLTAEDLREILEFEKIVQFRDAVLAGIHPRVKIHSHLIGKQANTTRNTSSPNYSTPRTNLPTQSTRSTSGTYYDSSSPYRNNKSPSNFRVPGGNASMTSKSEINPILLEKSDDLIKAEIQLQRQRLERALREQMDQQRVAKMVLDKTSESLPDFDLTEVLSKALTIVHPSTATAGVEPPVDGSASDSFDERTFYSSQHDSPQRSKSPPSPKNTFEANARNFATAKPPVNSRTSQNQNNDEDVVMTGALALTDNYSSAQAHSQELATQQVQVPSFGGQLPPVSKATANVSGGLINQDASKANNQQKNNATMSTQQRTSTSANMATNNPNPDPFDFFAAVGATPGRVGNDPDSPLVRAHNLSPLAPQPARVSPLATARQPPVPRADPVTDEAQPAQVAALRQKASGYSSTDSSPRGAKDPGKKKSKKEKRKKRKGSSNENAANSPDSPYIKPEPGSPSPFAVAPLPRPQKRQRQMGTFAAELNYDEPRYEPIDSVRQRGPSRLLEAGASRAYGRGEDRYEVEPRRAEPVYQRVERENGEYRRFTGEQYARRPASPGYGPSYSEYEPRSARAVSHAIVDGKTYEQPIYYRDPIPRASVRPDADRERSRSPVMRERRQSPVPMGPPRRPVRIIIDEYGREYIDPTPIPSMPPPSRYRDSEVVYERAPLRSVSVRAPPEQYEEDGVIYRRQSPPSVTPRRVVTQPEYAMPEHRAYRQRKYSVRPMAPPGDDFVQTRAPERRPMIQYEEAPNQYARAASVRPEAVRYEEPHREYIRAPTARPETIRYEEAQRECVRATTARPEPVRYEIPPDYRLQSVRPEALLRDPNASARPEGRGEVWREYSVRPGEVPQLHVDREVYVGRGAPVHVAGEVPYGERPRVREPSVMVYADNGRREVYR